ncbi:Sec-independent protein translocase protein TatB [Achromobacter aloeverae]|uniref:Sec-independent protein translocase protein TatB n=1 Tax=Achromobacter aloeverae TaxID=1750518 RepID=A0A4Q1HKE3_9BURK|nr:twin-arginine translocase subunit TatB [Achromobacter aloeverae]
MFDMSMGELVVIGVIALIVIGPERLPKVARTVGHLLGRAQRYVNDVKSDIRREIELDELRKFKSEMENAAQAVQTSGRDTTESLREPAQALRQELDDAAKAASGALSLSTPVVDEDGLLVHKADAAGPADTAPGSVDTTGSVDPAAPANPAAASTASPAAASTTASTAASTTEPAAAPATAPATTDAATPAGTPPPARSEVTPGANPEANAEAVLHGVPAPSIPAPAKPATPTQPPTGTPT